MEAVESTEAARQREEGSRIADRNRSAIMIIHRIVDSKARCFEDPLLSEERCCRDDLSRCPAPRLY
jgi:hypothetical protein